MPTLLAINSRFTPPLKEDEVERILDSIQKTHVRNHPEYFKRIEVLASQDSEELSPGLTDLGNSQRFLAAYSQDLRFVYKWKKWMVWDGKRWQVDTSGEVERRAKKTVRMIHEEAAGVSDHKRKDELIKHARKSESAERLRAMVEISKSDLAIDPEDLDRNPMLLNVINGTLDLETGELREHRREDYITKLAPVEYNPEAECPNWGEHLTRIFNGNQDLISFFRMAFGYSLTARTDADCLFISWGSGANGKTVTHEIFAKILGDYAMRIPSETFLVKPHGGIPNDIARLRGARFVFASEMEEGKKLAESLIKDFTGGDTVTARFLYGEFFEFKPTGKIWLATNHKPGIEGTDMGIWRRIRLIPFTVTIPEEERIPRSEFEALMMAEASGILAWAVKGCLKLIENGFLLPIPEEVKKATENYRNEMDILGEFLGECCIQGPDFKARVSDLYQEYEKYCNATKEKPISKRTFSLKMLEKGFTQRKGTKGVRIWVGIGIVDATREDAEPPGDDDITI